jgi:hypothetical protein
MSFSVFVCGRPQDAGRCTGPSCQDRHVVPCGFELKGHKAGQTCGRLVCIEHGHIQPSGYVFCHPHDQLARRTSPRS